MNILLISTSEKSGGAAIAARRLMFALNKYGEDVSARMLVRDKDTDDDNVSYVSSSQFSKKMKFTWERGLIWLCCHFDRTNLFGVSLANTGFDITRHPDFIKADIIHIHWTQQGMLSLRDMSRIFQSGKPVVWTMHDMWACTGICHYADDCQQFKEICKECPKCKSGVVPRVFRQKARLYRNPFEVVTCSHWLLRQAESSTLLKGIKIHCIANALDMEVFKPCDKSEARQKLSLPANKFLILFASQKVTDKRKGIDYLIDAAKILKRYQKDIEFIVMGSNAGQIAEMLPYKVHSMGFVSSVEQAATIYQAANLFVTPSLMDNLPNTIAESMACGTPCVGFNIGGIPEMIDHKTNGYVAQYKNAEDLACGIEWIMDHPDYETICRLAREKAQNSYGESVIAQQHCELYTKLIHENSNH